MALRWASLAPETNSKESVAFFDLLTVSCNGDATFTISWSNASALISCTETVRVARAAADATFMEQICGKDWLFFGFQVDTDDGRTSFEFC
jgi:hypothetical protein